VQIEWTRLEAAKITARVDPNDACQFTVTLRAPTGISTVHLMSGRQVSIAPDRLVAMNADDSKPLLAIGWDYK
jgi:hypothetical protein